MIKKVLTFGILFYMGATQCEGFETNDKGKKEKCRALALRGGGTKGNY